MLFRSLRPERETKPTPNNEAQRDLTQDRVLGEMQEYRAQFQSGAFASEIILDYQLTYTGVHEPRFDQLFSIHLHFDLTDPHYADVSDISVPFLFRERKPPVVRLRLRPRRPYPTTLKASAVFTTQDGLSWHTALADLQVTFPQLFLPLSAPLAWGEEHRYRLFEVMWKEMRSEEHTSELQSR